MSPFIEDLRRMPRVPVRCTVAVTRRGDGCNAETEDIGPGGCLLVTPRPLQVGEPVILHVECEQVAQPLRIRGRVAWVGGGDHLRAGISFTEEHVPSRSDPAAWFQALCQALPGIGARLAEVPKRISHEARLYLRPPPKFIVDFTPEELAVLEILDTGVTVGEVVAHPNAGPHAARAIFALLARRAITLEPMEAVPAWQWRPVLEGALGRPVGPSRRATPPPPPPPPRQVAAVQAERAEGPPAAAPAPSGPPPAAPPVRQAATPPKAPPRVRRPEAQECLDQARAAVDANDVHAAIDLLRRALALSPGDPEIATLLGQMAFKDRQV